MERLSALSLFGVLLLGCCACALNCGSKYEIQQEQLKCFKQVGLMQGADVDMNNVIQTDPSAVCRNSDDYRSALSCAVNVGKRCLQEAEVATDILPDADKMGEAITYMCRHLSEIDTSCVQNAQGAIKQCGITKALHNLRNMDLTDVRAITCMSFQLGYDCMKEELGHCSSRTIEVNLRLTNEYLRPPACSSFETGGEVPYRFTTMAPMTTVQLVTTMMALPDVSCYSQSSIRRAQQQCLRREGLNDEIPGLDSNDPTQAKQNFLDTVLANSKDIHTVCKEKLARQRAVTCAMEVARKCMPYNYQDYLPDGNSAASILDEICASPDDVDIKCASSKTSELFDCGYEKGTQHGQGVRNTKDLLCKAFHWNVDCQLEVLPDCGCHTTRMFVKMGKQLNPPACPAIRSRDPECHPVTGEFVSTGGAQSSQSFSLVVLSLAALSGLLIAF